MKDLFLKHLEQKLVYVRQILSEKNLDSLIIDSGLPQYYFQDDQTMPYRSNPHFLYFCPDYSPGHILQIKSTGKPKLIYYSPNDFWHENSSFDNPFWADGFDVVIIHNENKLWQKLDTTNGSHRCLTPQPEIAIQNDLELVDDSLLSALYWSRIQKSEYEIACIKEANRIASLGHLAAKKSFLDGKSEREIFQDYLKASNLFQFELPYGNIIALNEKSAILHYQNARDLKNGKTFLIDAGATFNGYCSDITRTYAADNAHPVFKELLSDVEDMQQKLWKMVKPGVDYLDIQDETHVFIAESLINRNILMNTSLDQALDLDLVSTFFPHGVGHALGLQVHDVAGKQINSQGTPSQKSSKHPYLRTLRVIQEMDVLTIEPGIYFIPMLLKDLKANSKTSSLVNWSLVDELIPFGGIRIEDDIAARSSGPENLTRPFLPN